jgi:hypothetical protein
MLPILALGLGQSKEILYTNGTRTEQKPRLLPSGKSMYVQADLLIMVQVLNRDVGRFVYHTQD